MSLSIYGHIVSRDRPPFVIAELGLNHSGDVDRALRLADAAADAGAGGVKVQAFRAERLVAPGCPAPTHVDAESLPGFFKGYELDTEAHARIAERAHSRGLAMVATPFDEDVVGELERIGCDAYKIASGDLTYHALIERAAATGKPLLISTGMANIDEIRLALDRARHAGSSDVAILHCVSAYPVPAGQENLSAIAELRRLYGIEVGLSDHSTEDLSLPLSIALGATLYERHIALDDGTEELERALSSTPDELRQLIRAADRARAALGSGRKHSGLAESSNLVASRRSLHATRQLRKGECLEPTCLVPLRPGHGIEPRRLVDVVGRRLVRDVPAGEPVFETDLECSPQEALSAVA